MHFSHAYIWDKGEYYTLNQDSYSLQTLMTGSGPYGMVMVCDGVGSLAKGEYASGLTVTVMTEWFYEQALPLLCRKISDNCLHRSLKRALGEVHSRLQKEGECLGTAMGTTFSLLILAPHTYRYFYIGDCACYKIGKKIHKIGKSMHGIHGELCCAVGVGNLPNIYIEKGFYNQNHTFLLCSDGFHRCLSAQAMLALGERNKSNQAKRKLMQEIVLRGRKKGEKDNCTGIIIGRT